MKTRRGPAGRVPSRKAHSFARPQLERFEDRLLMTIFTVSNTADTGAGSLRQAILDSNGSATQLPNIIDFSLPAGLQNITPGLTTGTALPAITQQVTIDGTTAVGYDPADPRPLIQIQGNSPKLPAGPAFQLNSGNVTLRALIIDNFQGAGVVINNGSSSVQGSWIGLNASGTALAPNTGEGITVSSGNNTIGGTTPAARNVISGNITGIHITGGGSTGNRIEGNYIGLDRTGLIVLGNTFNGIDVDTANNTIGGATSLVNGLISGAGNVIGGGFAALSINGFGMRANNNVVQGNFLGTDATGLKVGRVANGQGTKTTAFDGLDVDSTQNTLIGGADPSFKNVISGNGADGIKVSSSTSFNVRIQGNDIGVGVDGVTPLGNAGNGVEIAGASNVLVGGASLIGSTPELGNIIAYNGGSAFGQSGVLVATGDGDGILSNRIFSNTGLGIRLNRGNLGIMPPTLLSAQSGAAETRIVGSYNNSNFQNTAFRIQFFSTSMPNSSGSGDGMQFLGDLTVTTDGSGNANFTTVLMQGVPVGDYVTATVTQQVLQVNNTSEFSPDVPVTQAQVTDLGVLTSVPMNPPLLNQPYTYTVTVANRGPNDATGVVLTDTIPTGSTFVSASAGQFAAGVLTDNIGALASGATVNVTITVKPNRVSGTFVNTATVTGDQLDTDLANNTATTKGSVASNADLMATLTVSPNPAPIGTPLTYTLVVGNNGPSTANNATATVTLPDTLTDIVVSPDQGTFTLVGNVLTLNLGILPAGTASTTTITGTPSATGTINTTATVSSALSDPNPANNSVTLPVIVANAADLALQITASPDPVLVGQELFYTITVTNNGPSQASTPVVTDQLPASLMFVQGDSNAGGNGILGFSNGVVTASLNPLAAGGSDVITIAVTPTVSGQVSNSASVADPNATNPSEIDPDLTNNSATTTTQVSPADLGVIILNPPDPLLVGTPAVFQVVVTNNGPATATNVIVTDTFGPNATIVGSSAGLATGGKLVANLGTLASGASATLTITASLTASGNLLNSATVSSDEVDPNPNNNAATSSNLVSPVDLAVVVAGAPAPVLIGGQVAFVVTVTNNGPTTATNVLFNDTLPGLAVFGSATASQGAVAQSSANTVTGNLGTLAPGASATVTILVMPGVLGTATDTASVTSDGFDTNPANDTGSSSVPVIDLPGTVEVATPLVFATENSGFATISLVRVGGTLGTITVAYATSDLSAVAGVNYTASSGTVTFTPGQTTATIVVPVLDDLKVDGNNGFFVTLSNPTGGSSLDANSIAAVLVLNTDRDMIPPVVTGLVAIPGNNSINGFVIFFDKAMDPTRASLTSNYHVFLSNRDNGGKGDSAVPLAAALYSPITNSVTLIPTKSLPANRFYHVVANGSFGEALTDASGNVLFGNTGPGTNYDVFYGQGNSLRYLDSQGNSVSLSLTGGGILSIFRGSNGDAAAVNLTGVVPHKSHLTGTVQKVAKKASGRTSIGALNGLGQFGDVISNVKTPDFYVSSAPVAFAGLTGPTTVTAASISVPSVTATKKTPRGPLGF